MLTVGKLIVIGLILAVIGLVLGALVQIRKERRQQDLYAEPDLGDMRDLLVDDVVAVRRVTRDAIDTDDVVAADDAPQEDAIDIESSAEPLNQTDVIALNIFAHEKQVLGGYELLQALLACGFRFGEMDIFHRYQHDNGQGPILFSLACATEPGVFDMQNMGSFHCRGLLMFMELSGHPQIDEERFDLLLTCARQLAEELNAVVLDHKRNTLVENRITQYKNRIRLQSEVA